MVHEDAGALERAELENNVGVTSRYRLNPIITDGDWLQHLRSEHLLNL